MGNDEHVPEILEAIFDMTFTYDEYSPFLLFTDLEVVDDGK